MPWKNGICFDLYRRQRAQVKLNCEGYVPCHWQQLAFLLAAAIWQDWNPIGVVLSSILFGVVMPLNALYGYYVFDHINEVRAVKLFCFALHAATFCFFTICFFIYVFNFLEKMRSVFEHLIRMHHVNQSSSKNTKGWKLSWQVFGDVQAPRIFHISLFLGSLGLVLTTAFSLHHVFHAAWLAWVLHCRLYGIFWWPLFWR